MRHLSFSAFAHTRRGHTLLAAGAMLAISVIAGAALQPALSLRPRYRGAPALAARGVAPFVPRRDATARSAACLRDGGDPRHRLRRGCGPGLASTLMCGCATSMPPSCKRVAQASFAGARRARRHKRSSPRAASRSGTSASTNMPAASTPPSRRAEPLTSRPPCSRAASRAATTAGADNGNQEIGVRNQAFAT